MIPSVTSVIPCAASAVLRVVHVIIERLKTSDLIGKMLNHFVTKVRDSRGLMYVLKYLNTT